MGKGEKNMSWNSPAWEIALIKWWRRDYVIMKRAMGKQNNYIDDYYVPWYFWLPYMICSFLLAFTSMIGMGIFNLMFWMEKDKDNVS